MSFAHLTPQAILDAQKRIEKFTTRTPLLHSSLLNSLLSHEIIFKAECFQKIGAFKFRGALNAMLALKEQGQLPKEIIAFSSGNHAQGVALAGKILGVKTTILMNHSSSKIKQQATKAYGAEIIHTKNRIEAEQIAAQMVQQGAYLIHPYDNDMVIAGQGTACLEALQDGAKPDAIFTPCGGGGLTSGTYLAKELLKPNSLLFASEPEAANDAAQSYRSGKIVSLPDTPNTIADGVMTLAISPRTFHYLQKIDGFFEISEDDIFYWTQWLQHLLKIAVEPSSALAMAAAYKWLASQKSKKQVLIILSGGNIDPETYRRIWEKNYLDKDLRLKIAHS